MAKRRGVSYKKRVEEVNRIYDRECQARYTEPRDMAAVHISCICRYRTYILQYTQRERGCEKNRIADDETSASFYSLMTMTMNKDVQKIIARILQDIRVEMTDEFDRNFERQAFFSEAWQRRKSPTRPGGSILIDTGPLRRSI